MWRNATLTFKSQLAHSFKLQNVQSVHLCDMVDCSHWQLLSTVNGQICCSRKSGTTGKMWFKYFIQNSTTSTLFLYGQKLVFLWKGETLYELWSTVNNPSLIVSIVCSVWHIIVYSFISFKKRSHAFCHFSSSAHCPSSSITPSCLNVFRYVTSLLL